MSAARRTLGRGSRPTMKGGSSPVRSLWWERTPAAGRRPAAVAGRRSVASLLGRRPAVVGLLELAPKPGACAHRCWSWGGGVRGQARICASVGRDSRLRGKDGRACACVGAGVREGGAKGVHGRHRRGDKDPAVVRGDEGDGWGNVDESIPASRVVWMGASESATQSVMAGRVRVIVLNDIASDC